MSSNLTLRIGENELNKTARPHQPRPQTRQAKSKTGRDENEAIGETKHEAEKRDETSR